MDDMEKARLQQVASVMKSLAEGLDPETGDPLPEDTVLNRVSLARAFFYAYEKLNEMPNLSKSRTRTGETIKWNDEFAAYLSSTDEKVSLSRFCQNLSLQIEEKTGKLFKMDYVVVRDWLTAQGYLMIKSSGKRKSRLASELGAEKGLVNQEMVGAAGRYVAVLYAREGQNLIIENIVRAYAFRAEVDRLKSENQQIMNGGEYVALMEKINDGKCIREIAEEMGRTESEVAYSITQLEG